MFGILMHDKLFFARYFFRDELTLPMSTTQKVMINDYNRKRLKCTGRKVWKTGSLESEVIRVALTNTEEGLTEAMFVGPAQNHISPVWDRVLSRLNREPFFNALFAGSNKQAGTMKFHTGFIWHWRIEGCLHPDSTILDASTGKLYRIEDMAKGDRPKAIHTVDPETYAMKTTSDYDVFSTGEHRVLELTTTDNWSLKATDEHRFLTPTGWAKLKDLAPGDFICVAHHLPCQSSGSLLADQAKLVGHLAGREPAIKVDAIPSDIVRREVEKSGYTHNGLCRILGYGEGIRGVQKHIWKYDSVGRSVAEKINDVIASPVLANLLQRKLTWFKVKSITPAGVVPTYDLHVPGTHSYIANGFIIHNSSGTGVNMVGLRAKYIKGDEMAYGNHAAEKERHQTALPGCDIEYCGVPNGLRDSPFYELDQTQRGNSFSRHKLSSYDNPIFQYEGAKAQLVAEHGGEHTFEYVTQVLGQWGDSATSSFSAEKINIFRATFGDIAEIRSKAMPMRIFTLTEQEVINNIDQLETMISVPKVNDIEVAVLGVDVGFGGPDPTVITAWYRNTGSIVWKCLLRVNLLHVGIALYQSIVIDHIAHHCLKKKVKKICIDNIGYGKALCDKLFGPDVHDIIRRHDDYSNKVVNADLNGYTEIEVPDPTLPAGFVIKKVPNKQHYSMLLKQSIYGDGDLPMVFPDDQEAFDELTTTVETRTGGGYIVYHPARKNQDHISDSYRLARKAIQAWAEDQIVEELEDFSQYGWMEASIPGGNAKWAPSWY